MIFTEEHNKITIEFEEDDDFCEKMIAEHGIGFIKSLLQLMRHIDSSSKIRVGVVVPPGDTPDYSGV